MENSAEMRITMGINYDILGQNIQTYRKRKKITQEQFAEALNLSVSFISQLERGVAKTSLDTLSEISDYLDCSMGMLLNYSSKEDPLLLDLITTYQSLSRKQQIQFYHMLKAFKEFS